MRGLVLVVTDLKGFKRQILHHRVQYMVKDLALAITGRLGVLVGHGRAYSMDAVKMCDA